MAIARLSVKVGKSGKAAPHARYIARLGLYAKRLDLGEHLIATGVGNMPAWARENPLLFWEAADEFERKNGSVYREQEIALPRELTEEQMIQLVQDWLRQEFGERYVYQWAIHSPRAADGKEQPHLHLMFSERTLDGIERDPEQFFKRYNAKNPDRGGCKKANTGLDFKTRSEQLKALRERWQDVCNRALERAGQDARIDMRSYKDRGLDTEPERKMLPSEWRQSHRRAEIIDFRQARDELTDSRKELARLIPDMGAKIIELQAERARRERREAARQEFEASHREPELDRFVMAQALAAMVANKAGQVREDIRNRWQERQRQRAIQQKERRIRAKAEQRAANQPAEKPRNRIICGDSSLWQDWRKHVLSEIYSTELAEKYARYFKINKLDDGILLYNARNKIFDFGDAIEFESKDVVLQNDYKLLADIVKNKGWNSVTVEGSEDFVQRFKEELLKNDPSIRIIEKLHENPEVQRHERESTPDFF